MRRFYLRADSCSSEMFSTKKGATPTVETCSTAVSVSVWTVSSSAIRFTSRTILWYASSTDLSRTSRVCARFFFALTLTCKNKREKRVTCDQNQKNRNVIQKSSFYRVILKKEIQIQKRFWKINGNATMYEIALCKKETNKTAEYIHRKKANDDNNEENHTIKVLLAKIRTNRDGRATRATKKRGNSVVGKIPRAWWRRRGRRPGRSSGRAGSAPAGRCARWRPRGRRVLACWATSGCAAPPAPPPRPAARAPTKVPSTVCSPPRPRRGRLSHHPIPPIVSQFQANLIKLNPIQARATKMYRIYQESKLWMSQFCWDFNIGWVRLGRPWFYGLDQDKLISIGLYWIRLD